MTPEELHQRLWVIEKEYDLLYKKYEKDLISKQEHNFLFDKIVKKQVNLIENFKREILTDFLDFLLKNGYCDTDVYCEPPTAIDQYLIFNKQK